MNSSNKDLGWCTQLEELALMNQHLSIWNTKEIQTVISGLHLSERVFASIPEGSTLNQVFIYFIVAAGMKEMYLDKHGACSVLAAFQTLVEEKTKINLTVSVGFV